jgi:hypothetical protein
MRRSVLLAAAVVVACPALAAPRDPLGPALVALAMAKGPDALPAVEDVRTGLPTRAGAVTVCGTVTYEGLGEPPTRFFAIVDLAAQQHQALAIVKFERDPGFGKDWNRHCRFEMS